MTAGVASYGVSDDAGMGRAHCEGPPAALKPFDFDLRRVLCCSAFRRLQYKTQVFISPRDDHFRTRLTHTLEVASLARLLASALRVNVALAEAVALAHDLGHPPFGHAGEAALNRLMRDHGGFEHNAQSLRVIDYLEHPFPPFRGLNLSYEVREALAKHRTAYDHPTAIESNDAALLELVQRGPQPTIEGQIVGLADRLAYDCHDLEDALSAEILSANQLVDVELWAQSAVEVRAAHPNSSLFGILRPVLERLQQRLIDDAVAATLHRISEAGVTTPDQARRLSEPLVGLAPAVNAQVRVLESVLRGEVYRHPAVVRKDQTADRMISQLFGVYVDQPQHLPARFADRIGRQSVHRVACDYIAGMTDRFCESEFRRLFMPFSG